MIYSGFGEPLHQFSHKLSFSLPIIACVLLIVGFVFALSFGFCGLHVNTNEAMEGKQINSAAVGLDIKKRFKLTFDLWTDVLISLEDIVEIFPADEAVFVSFLVLSFEDFCERLFGPHMLSPEIFDQRESPVASVREAHVLLNMFYHPRELSEGKIVILVLIILPKDGLDFIACDIDPQLFYDILELGELDRVAFISIDESEHFKDAASL